MKRTESLFNQRTVIAILLITLISAMVAIPVSAENTEERVYVTAMTSESKTWDPMVGYGAGSDMVTFNLYEALLSVEYTEEGGWEFYSLLATDWEIADDYSEITFQLREGVTFHDQTPFNSSAVKFWFDRMLGVNRGPAWLYATYIEEVDPVDTYTVVVKLTEPTPTFDILSIMSNPFGAYGIVSPTYVLAHATDEDPWAAEWMYDHACGTGPYMLESVTHGTENVWVKFEDYWGGWEGHHIDRVVFKVIGDTQVQLMQFLSGEIDALSPDYSQIDDIQNQKEDAVLFVDQTFLSELYIFMNMAKEGPLQDINVRKAISYAFDYEGVVEEVYGGYALQGRGPLPHTIPDFDPDAFQYSYNLTKAKEYMAMSEYANGFSALIVPAPGNWEQIAQVFQSNVAELGIDVEIQAMPYSVLWDLMSDPETAPEFTIALWYPDYPTADSYITPVFGPLEWSWQNWAYYDNEVVNQLLDDARFEFDEATRTEIYEEIQGILIEDAPCVYMIEEDRLTFLQSYVEGYHRVPSHQAYAIYKMSVEGKYPAEDPEPEPAPKGIPGFPYESVVFGVVAGAVLVWYLSKNK